MLRTAGRACLRSSRLHLVAVRLVRFMAGRRAARSRLLRSCALWYHSQAVSPWSETKA
ncbi:hypothetical protein HMPREF0762_01807 [Slackia exigua ATCC 700122]|uniref:Uncharacterized protein n=1 Tax=Slackia exigua (strain ATCC 700122 / DSM 15923 / CIP 105133 / JCM 11022 / KCTC 5966 / S-7) TaxID=649764 RepID=D0WIY2_SLAES|nr:hypothetical protein HMPREF0762_01807 [Slackia exigua ATCC 700122]